MEFLFTDECKTGISQIDYEHKYLFSLMNDISKTLEENLSLEEEKDGLEKYVKLLMDYGKIHFANEERYMEEKKDIELPRQKREHAMFMHKMETLDFQDLNDSEKKVMLEDTLKYLVKWLFYHILGSDTLIGKVVKVSDEIKKDTKYCLFTEKYMTGIPNIDREHKMLFDIIEEAFRMVESEESENIYDEIMDLLDDLEEYTTVHFASEEAYMESINHPYLYIKQQKTAHAIFIDKMHDRYNGEMLENHKEFLEEMLDFLYSWLSNHILKMDKLIGHFRNH